MSKQQKHLERELEVIKSSIESTYGNSKDYSEIKQTGKEIQMEVKSGKLSLLDKLLFLVEMIDSGKHFAAWVEEEGQEVKEENKAQFQYNEESDAFENKYDQSLNLNLNALYDNIHLESTEILVYPVSNDSKEIRDLLLYYLPEDYCYLTLLNKKHIVVHKEKPFYYERSWMSQDEQHLPYAYLFKDLHKEHIYEIRRYEVSSFEDRELMFRD